MARLDVRGGRGGAAGEENHGEGEASRAVARGGRWERGGVQEPREAALLGGARLSLAEAPGAGQRLEELGPRSTGSLALGAAVGQSDLPPWVSAWPAGAGRAGSRPPSGLYGKQMDVARPLFASLSPPPSVSGFVLAARRRGRGGLQAGAAAWEQRGERLPGACGPRACPRCCVLGGLQVEVGQEKEKL